MEVALEAGGEEGQGRVDPLEGLGLGEYQGVGEMLQEGVRMRVCSIVQAEAK
jgi:hypothetical protein